MAECRNRLDYFENLVDIAWQPHNELYGSRIDDGR
jgi:hypothetical protein